MTDTTHGSLAQAWHLIRPFRGIILACMLCGVLGGFGVTALLATVNQGLHATADEHGRLILAFAALCLLVLIGSTVSDIGTNIVGQRIIADLRVSLAAKILAAPIDQLERYRTHRLIPVLTQDIDTVSDFAFLSSSFAVAITVTLGCLVYLAWLSPSMALVTVAAILVGTVAQGWARTRGVRGFMAARESEDELQKHYRAIAEGAKELRINRPRRLYLHTRKLRATVARISAAQIASINLFVTAKAFGTSLFFIVIGVTLVLRAVLWPDTEPAVLSGFVLVLLYMKGPLDQIISAIPLLSRAQVAIRRIADLSERFSNPEPHLLVDTPDAGRGPARPRNAVATIELRGVTYGFPAPDGAQPFRLGPVDLTIRGGDTVFIVGENGCGKTTLIKLLLGLYVPQAGEVLLDGEPVDAAGRDDYRQSFTTVFADYYLFDDPAGDGDPAIPEHAARYLERLEVAHKVSLKDGAFTTTDLSTGQRKRLALLNAWIENRPVLVFDEWAADQDPTFRRIFYTELLPDLKRLGKTIVVISHDDRYFHVADHLVRMEAGRIVESRRAA